MAKLEIEESCKGEITVQCWDKNEIVIEGQEIYIENGKELINDYVNTDILPHISQYAADEIKPYVSVVEEAATNAASSATNAATSETNAASSATNAATSETNAETSANRAANGATTAASYASSAEASATNAATSASAAATSTTSAANYATAAKNSASSAETSATTASSWASSAQLHSQTALAHANSAKSWAIGDITEQAEGSAKYWVEQAESSVAEANVTKIVTLTETSGTFTLETNKVYSAVIDGDTFFNLPETVDTEVFNQIKVMLKVTGSPAVTWGTSCFFNKESPTLEEGYYDVYFDYDNNLGSWVAGVLAKGAVS